MSDNNKKDLCEFAQTHDLSIQKDIFPVKGKFVQKYNKNIICFWKKKLLRKAVVFV